MFPLFLLKAHLEDLCDQYDAERYLIDWLDLAWSSKEIRPFPVNPGDKVVVVAKLQEEDTKWIEEELPE